MPQLKSSLTYSHRWYTKYFWHMFLFNAALLLIVVPLFQKGTFIDGMLYKTVALNASKNTGSFWQLKFTNTSMTFFCEQPPLYFYALGWFYKLFGVNYLTDRFFTLLLFILPLLVIKSLLPRPQNVFLLLFTFFLLTIPVFCWSYVNQVIEPFVCLLFVVAIFLFVNYKNKQLISYNLLFGLIVFSLFLAKGFQSCFIVMLPVVYFASDRLNKKAALFLTLLAVTFLLLFATVIFFYEPAHNWFSCYYNTRLTLTMQNVGQTTNYYAEIIIRFFTELIIPLLFLLMTIFLPAYQKKYPVKIIFKNFASNKMAMALLITSLAGSFPYAISLVQRGFYLLPAFVCFVLALIIGFKRYWVLFIRWCYGLSKRKWLAVVNVLLLVAVITYSFLWADEYKRDKSLLTDAELIKPYLKNNTILQVEESLWNYFTLHSLMYIDKGVSLTTDSGKAEYFLTNKNYNQKAGKLKLKKINLSTTGLDLYKVERR